LHNYLILSSKHFRKHIAWLNTFYCRLENHSFPILQDQHLDEWDHPVDVATEADFMAVTRVGTDLTIARALEDFASGFSQMTRRHRSRILIKIAFSGCA
jgi:hypothetical protein